MSPQDKQRAFRLLGISPTEDAKEIRRAWRGLVRTYHPDLAKEDQAEANRKLAEINEAFDLLMAAESAAKRLAEEQAKREADREADVARRMAAARRAEARRAAEAREAAAERAAHAAHLARKKAEEKARAEAQARQEAEAAKRRKAAADARRAARKAAGSVVPSSHDAAVAQAARAFTQAISVFTGSPNASRHNSTC